MKLRHTKDERPHYTPHIVVFWWPGRNFFVLNFFSVRGCFHSASRQIDSFKAWARQSTNSRSSSMEDTSLRSCLCCCQANLDAWSSFISINNDKKDSNVSPFTVRNERTCWLSKSCSCNFSTSSHCNVRDFHYGLHMLLMNEPRPFNFLLGTFHRLLIGSSRIR